MPSQQQTPQYCASASYGASCDSEHLRRRKRRLRLRNRAHHRRHQGPPLARLRVGRDDCDSCSCPHCSRAICARLGRDSRRPGSCHRTPVRGKVVWVLAMQTGVRRHAKPGVTVTAEATLLLRRIAICCSEQYLPVAFDVPVDTLTDMHQFGVSNTCGNQHVRAILACMSRPLVGLLA